MGPSVLRTSMTLLLILVFIILPVRSLEAATELSNSPADSPQVTWTTTDLGHQTISAFFPNIDADSNHLNSVDSSLDQNQLSEFRDKFTKYVEFASKNGLIANQDEFKAWWQAHSGEYLNINALQRFKNLNLEQFVTILYLYEQKDKAQTTQDIGGFIRAITKPLDNPRITQTFAFAGTILGATMAGLLGIVKGATIAGPAAGVVGALLDPIAGKIREWAAVQGAKMFSRPAQWLGRKVSMATSAVAVAKANPQTMKTFRANLDKIDWGHVTPEEQALLRQKLIEDAVVYTQLVNSINTPTVRDGRQYIDSTIFVKPLTFSSAISTFDTNKITHKMAMDRLLDKFEAKGAPETDLQAFIEKAQKDIHSSSFQQLKSSLVKKYQLNEKQLLELIEHQNSMDLAQRQIQQTIRNWAISVAIYPEFDEALPDKMKNEVRQIRNEMGFNDLVQSLRSITPGSEQLSARLSASASAQRATASPSNQNCETYFIHALK